LEEIASDYLNLLGYITQTNIKFKPSKTDPEYRGKDNDVNSDIDVLGFNPLISSPGRVVAISCKSYRGGLRLWRKLILSNTCTVLYQTG
jgi:hypothetical protein